MPSDSRRSYGRGTSSGGRGSETARRSEADEKPRERDEKPRYADSHRRDAGGLSGRGGGSRGGGRGASRFSGGDTRVAPSDMVYDTSRLEEEEATQEATYEMQKKKATGRCRLFIGNISLDVSEQEVKELFSEHGKVEEFFLSGKGFAFIRMDSRAHAESAKENLDGHLLKGRPIRVRFAVHGASIKVKELSPFVSNELLYQAFSMFGDVERAVHIVDEKGRPLGEGIVEFERKQAAQEALRQISDGSFLITNNLRPITAEPLDPRDEDDGLSEKMLHRNAQYVKEREEGPRFAVPRSFEAEFGRRWKELYGVEKSRREQLDKELKEGRQQLTSDMDFAYQDYQTQMLREDLKRRQDELERLEGARLERMEMMRRRQEARSEQMGAFGQQQHYFQNAFAQQQQQQQEMMMAPPPFGQNVRAFEQQQQEMMATPFEQGFPTEQAYQAEQSGPGGGSNDNLVHGVQKLMQMFKGGPGSEVAEPTMSLGAGFDMNHPAVSEAAMSQMAPGMIEQQMGIPPGYGGQGQPAEFSEFQRKRRRF